MSEYEQDDEMNWLTDAESVEEALNIPAVVNTNQPPNDVSDASYSVLPKTDLPLTDEAEISEDIVPIDPKYEEYILTEYQSTINQLNVAIQSLENDVNADGTPPKIHEVYSNLCSTKLSALKDMTQLRFTKKRLTLQEAKSERELELRERKLNLDERKTEKKAKELESGDTPANGAIPMTPDQMADFARRLLEKKRLEVDGSIDIVEG